MFRKVDVLKRSLFVLPNCRLNSTLPSAVAEDYQSAFAYEDIPGPSQFELIRSFLPGGNIQFISFISEVVQDYFRQI